MYKNIISDGKGEIMKKIILIIFICFIYCFNNGVSADTSKFSGAEFLDGISYVKYDGVYYHFKNAQAIRNISNSNIAYCIEPFENLVDNSSYIGYENFNNKFNLSQSDWNRIALLSYYGYGYPGHNDKKWISITQMLIWKTVDKKSSFNWIDNVYNRNIIYPYNKEIDELEELIKNHNVKPRFSDELVFSVNSIAVLEDFNNVIDNYEIKYSDFDAYIKDNSLFVNLKEEMVGKIILRKRDYSNNKVQFFYSQSSQSIVERGIVDSSEVEIVIKSVSGSIEINKIDSTTMTTVALGEASLIGAIYEVFDLNDNLVGEIVIGNDNKGRIEKLEFGTYLIKEKSAGVGYYVDSNLYSVTIDSANLNVSLTLSNDVIKTKVIITKYFGSKEDYRNNQMSLEPSVTFNFYDYNNELFCSGTTNEFGMLEVELPYGNYKITQINSMIGYSLSNDIEIFVNEDSNVSINIPVYDIEIEVPNAFVFNYRPLIINIMEMLLKRIRYVL